MNICQRLTGSQTHEVQRNSFSNDIMKLELHNKVSFQQSRNLRAPRTGQYLGNLEIISVESGRDTVFQNNFSLSNTEVPRHLYTLGYSSQHSFLKCFSPRFCSFGDWSWKFSPGQIGREDFFFLFCHLPHHASF